MRDKFYFIFSTFRGNARMAATSYTIYPDGHIVLNNVELLLGNIDELTDENAPLGKKTKGNLCRIEQCKIVQSWGGMMFKSFKCSPTLNELDIMFVLP